MALSTLLGAAQDFEATRMNDHVPLITQQHFTDLGVTNEEGENINGPSLIRLPDWIPLDKRVDSSAVYYLYFAHHQGNYIRLAWATELEGPYYLYGTGKDVAVEERGVLDLGADDKIYLDNGIIIEKHVASPDVHVDDNNQRIIMYFHSPTEFPGGQRTFVSFSPYGLSFLDSIQPVALGGSYFKVFDYKYTMYAVDNRADIYQGGRVDDSWKIPAGFNFENMLWTQPKIDHFQVDLDADPALAGTGIQIRHVGVHVAEDTLYVFYSRIGDAPERIMLSTIRLDNRTFEDWDSSYPPMEILRPEFVWEGFNLPNLPSDGGSSKEKVNQLRDPDVFEDSDSSLYLLYTGAGEFGIGLAKLERPGQSPVNVTSVMKELRPVCKVLMHPSLGRIVFDIRSQEHAAYTLRIFGLDGKLLKLHKGRCQPDGTDRFEWNPEGLRQGIYISNMQTKQHSVSVKFVYQVP